ncbi:MAG: hypothetical protein KJ072_15405 [Verrucomicrobia bacterium]|nr:hypothetical protein [Verrucomicrobiota bacterium]
MRVNEDIYNLIEAAELDPEQEAKLERELAVLQTTDMALIVSPGQNEISQMQTRGLDIGPHRQRMNDSQPPLDEKFKDSDDPLRLVVLEGNLSSNWKVL